ncbi:MAG: HMA2 domain-containing protein [Candidatus Tectimicrobiota bacterium]
MVATIPGSPYLHLLEGRLRIKIPELKGAQSRALALAQRLEQLEGIDAVTANPTTGNVLILFNSAQLEHRAIIRAIQQCGYLATILPMAPSERRKLTHVVFQSAVELVIERLVLALI